MNLLTFWMIQTTRISIVHTRKTVPLHPIIPQWQQHLPRVATDRIPRVLAKREALQAVKLHRNDALWPSRFSRNILHCFLRYFRHSPSKDPKLSTLIDQLDREIDRYAHREGTDSYRCLVCSRPFISTQALMLHLELSYPSFRFQMKENIIEVSFRNAYQPLISSKIERNLYAGQSELLFK